jgi:hypothetical protein
VRSELARRGVHLHVFAPTDRPTRAGRGEPVEVLGDTGEVDLLVAAGPGLVEGPHRWHAADAAEEAALRDAGVGGRIDVTAHPAVLLPRLLPREVLDKRLEYLRLMGWFPPEGPALITEGPAERILADHPELAPVTLPGFLSLEDVAAAIAAADGFAGSPAGCLLALGYGKPAAADDDAEEFARAEKAAPDAELLQRLQAEVDAWLDSLAEEARTRARPAPPTAAALESELRALRRAHRARTERANAERVLLADRVARAEAEAAAARHEADHLRRRVDEVGAARARSEAESAALRSTRTFRWTAAARAVYRRLRR